jgi:hypothetical protein
MNWQLLTTDLLFDAVDADEDEDLGAFEADEDADAVPTLELLTDEDLVEAVIALALVEDLVGLLEDL